MLEMEETGGQGRRGGCPVGSATGEDLWVCDLGGGETAQPTRLYGSECARLKLKIRLWWATAFMPWVTVANETGLTDDTCKTLRGIIREREELRRGKRAVSDGRSGWQRLKSQVEVPSSEALVFCGRIGLGSLVASGLVRKREGSALPQVTKGLSGRQLLIAFQRNNQSEEFSGFWNLVRGPHVVRVMCYRPGEDAG